MSYAKPNARARQQFRRDGRDGPQRHDMRHDTAGNYARELDELRRFAHLLDEAFRVPIIGYRIGLEPLLGLIPVIGDLSGLALSSYLILRAARLGVPRSLVTRMILNALIDTFIGNIPVIGDLFDFFWKVNQRNLRLLERHLLARA